MSKDFNCTDFDRRVSENIVMNKDFNCTDFDRRVSEIMRTIASLRSDITGTLCMVFIRNVDSDGWTSFISNKGRTSGNIAEIDATYAYDPNLYHLLNSNTLDSFILQLASSQQKSHLLNIIRDKIGIPRP